MRVVVCGSRDFDDWELFAGVMNGMRAWHHWPSDTVILEGACPYGGADKMAEMWAAQWEHGHEAFPPAIRPGWSKPTSYEFLARNRAMIDSGADLCVAFVNKPLEKSRGTAYTVDYARKQGVKTIVVEVQ
jgi:hypothetical protein